MVGISFLSRITPEHALEMHKQITNSELAIIPGVHGEYIGEITTLKPDFKESNLVKSCFFNTFNS